MSINKTIIRELCQEVDKTLIEKKDNPRLRELAVRIISNSEGLTEEFIGMASDIHNIDSDTELDDKLAKEMNLLTFDKFLQELQKIKDENTKFWE